MATDLDLKLLVVPARLSMSQCATFQAGVEATNRSGQPIEPQLAETTLEVDGRRCAAWDAAVHRGPPNPPWHRLCPAQRLSVWWPLGSQLFAGPGRYQLVLKLGELESVAEVEVTP